LSEAQREANIRRVEIQEFAEEYRSKTDEELLRLALEPEQLTPEAKAALNDELTRRKIGTERLKVFSHQEERRRRKEAFRSKRPTADRWKSRIGMSAVYALGVLIYHLLPSRFQIPAEWEDAAVVTFLGTVAIGFCFSEFWKRFIFWIALAAAAVAQLWVIKVLNPQAHWHYKNASFVTGLAVGFLVWGGLFLLLRRVYQDSGTRSDYRRE